MIARVDRLRLADAMACATKELHPTGRSVLHGSQHDRSSPSGSGLMVLLLLERTGEVD